MKQKILAVFTTVTAALVCSLALTITAFAEEYPVIHREEVTEMPDCNRGSDGRVYLCDHYGDITDTPLDGIFENYRYEIEYYQNGVGYTGIAIVDGEEWKFENGTALNGEYEENGGYVTYIDGKPFTGPYTYLDSGFCVPGHVDSYTNKYGTVTEAAVGYNCWRYAENGSQSSVNGWYGPEDYRRFYDRGCLLDGCADGKFYEKGLVFSGFYSHLNYIAPKFYVDGEVYNGYHQVTEEDRWYYTTTDEIKESWNFEVGKTYLFINDYPAQGFQEENGCKYWYENGLRQGTEGRGKEIYDPASDAWYWLDAVDNGKVATSKDVYQESYAGAYADRPDGTGKWVRYDENGHMIKGWCDTEAGTYYFDPETGAMAKGTATINGKEYTFDKNTGLLTTQKVHDCEWVSVDGKEYWYENGVRQGYDPENPDYRGKEIYDPASDAWYWLDNIQQGAKAVGKDVYQESWAGSLGDNGGYGKWVRYDENGHMVKGWQSVLQEGEIKGHYDTVSYYFDLETGAMAKGKVSIIEVFEYEGTSSVYECISLFDETDGHRVEVISWEPYTGDREVGSAIRLE